MLKLSHIRDILAVAEHGGLRAAGRHLGVNQPAITRSIRELEQELGATVLERHAKGVRLTEVGQAFVRRAAAMHTELRRAREEIQQIKGRNVGQVSVALSTGSSISLMPSAFAAFRKRCPEARLTIKEAFFKPIEGDLLAGLIDFYVGPFDEQIVTRKFMVEKLFDNQGIVFARKEHPLSSARWLKDLAGASWVRPALSGQTRESDFDSLFEQQGLPLPDVVLDAGSALITLIAVANSDLLTILPRQWRGSPLVGELVQELDVQDRLLRSPICIVRRQDMPLTPLAELVSDLTRRAASTYVHEQGARQGRF